MRFWIAGLLAAMLLPGCALFAPHCIPEGAWISPATQTPMAEMEKVVREPRFNVTIDLNLGTANYVVYTSDLSEEYVDFNASEYNAAVHAKRQKGFV